MFALAPSIARNGGRVRAQRMLDRAIVDADNLTIHGSTTGAEIFGLLNLMRAHLAARDENAGTAHVHLDEAAEIAALTGEHNSYGQHFGPTNVELWRASIGAELGEGRRLLSGSSRVGSTCRCLTAETGPPHCTSTWRGRTRRRPEHVTRTYFDTSNEPTGWRRNAFGRTRSRATSCPESRDEHIAVPSR